MNKPINERIREAEERLKQLKAKQQQIEARKRAAEAKAKRAADTRKKILLGALALQLMESDGGQNAVFMDRLDRFLVRTDDRALFGLQPKGESANASQP